MTHAEWLAKKRAKARALGPGRAEVLQLLEAGWVITIGRGISPEEWWGNPPEQGLDSRSWKRQWTERAMDGLQAAGFITHVPLPDTPQRYRWEQVQITDAGRAALAEYVGAGKQVGQPKRNWGGYRLRYYVDERKRHAAILGKHWTPEEAKEAILRLNRHFCPARREMPPRVDWTSGGRRSTYRPGGRTITLNCTHAEWLTVAHEFAHYWDHVREGMRPRKWHGKKHARLVDRTVAYMVKRGWPDGALHAERERRSEAAKARHAERPQMTERGRLILIRRQQADGLEEKIRRQEGVLKALRTRLSRKKRAITMLERHEAKAAGQ